MLQDAPHPSGVGLSAQQVARPRQQGKQRTGEVVWYGQQSGTVMLSDRKLAVNRPRLRQKGPGAGKEVEAPAYAAMQDGSANERSLMIS